MVRTGRVTVQIVCWKMTNAINLKSENLKPKLENVQFKIKIRKTASGVSAMYHMKLNQNSESCLKIACEGISIDCGSKLVDCIVNAKVLMRDKRIRLVSRLNL